MVRAGAEEVVGINGPIAVVVGNTSGWLPPRVLAPWLEDPQIVGEVRRMSGIIGLDLIHLGTVAGQTELADPKVGQPLATALEIITGERLLAAADPDRVFLAGHGVGEIAAAVLAGVLQPAAGLELSVELGHAHAIAAAAEEGGQIAVLGGYPPDIEERAAALNLSVAAYNGPGDMTLSGTRAAIGQLLAAPLRHTRIEPLPTVGAFSSALMAPAAERIRRSLSTLDIGEPRLRLLSGVDGRPAPDGRAYLEGTVRLLTGSVRWDLIMKSFAGDEVGLIMEVPPAGVLSAVATRSADVKTVPLRTLHQLNEATGALARR